MARRLGVVVAVTMMLAACGGDDAAPTTTATAPTSTAAESTVTTSATTTTTAPAVPSVLSFESGRGDDASLETAIWLGADPFVFDDYRVVIGTDADESYPGTGDPLPHLDGYLEITPEGATLVDAGTAVATGADVVELASWGFAEGVLRVFFIGTVPAKAGVAWVIVQVDGSTVPGGVAGAPFGTSCSYHSAGLALEGVPTGIPDAGVPCRYPLG